MAAMDPKFEKKAFKKLIQKFLDGTATEEEIHFLNNYYNLHDREPNVLELFSEEHRAALSQKIADNILHRINAGEINEDKRPQPKRKYYGWAAAAVALILVTAGGYFFTKKQTPHGLQAVNEQINPGKDGAILTLSNGKRVILDSSVQNNIAVQGNVKITNSGGIVTYSVGPSQTNPSDATAYNTLETPRGRRFKIVLPDGTQVWLNSASKLQYPTAFYGKERKVELSGEAYFEVVHKPEMPFIVQTKRTDVKVLGTGFNVMAYDDENSEQTTLVHGLVRVSSVQDSAVQSIIKPGQQAVLRSAENKFMVRKADTSEVTAWINGNFIFDNNNIKSVMRQIARWYDVSVRYEGNVDNIRFEGLLSRKENITDILEAIQATNEAHFNINGRTITVIAGANKE